MERGQADTSFEARGPGPRLVTGPCLVYAGTEEPAVLRMDVHRLLEEEVEGGRGSRGNEVWIWGLGTELEGQLLPFLERSGLPVGGRLEGGNPAVVGLPAAGAVIVFSVNRAREAAGLVERGEARLATEVDLQREVIIWELGRLYDLTARLRRDCPWDRRQTQESIVTYTLEETYELVDAVRSTREVPDRHAAISGELGDLLFQVCFLARVAQQESWYDLGMVASGIRTKLIRRHPHIFGEAVAETPEDVRRTWDEIKRSTEGREGIFHDVPASFPATLFAQKLQQRAASVGFDWKEAGEVLPKLHEELGELEEVLSGCLPGPEERERLTEEVGDLLFAVINLARKLKVDPEISLRLSSDRFRGRLEEAARMAAAEGKVFEVMALDEQEEYYQRAKAALRAER